MSRRYAAAAALGLWAAVSSAQPYASTPDWVAAPVPEAGARFGAWAAAVGDVDGDGLEDAAFGAPGADGEVVDEGRVYVYAGGPSGLAGAPSWSVDPTDQAGSEFGHCIAGWDVNADGYHWRARVVSPATGAGGVWRSFGANPESEADFLIGDAADAGLLRPRQRSSRSRCPVAVERDQGWRTSA